jgi:hypothetical protein
MSPKRMLAATLLLAPLAAHAADQDFKIVNKTGYQIDSVFLSPPNDDHWGSDVMGQDALADGEAANISFSKGTQACKWDLKVTYHDDSSTAVWHGLDLCSISKVSLHWNDKTQETTARAE